MTHVGCEACHGPGSLHVIMYGDPDLIVKPVEDFDAQQANDACGMCHVRGKSSTGKFSFLWDDETDHAYVLGEPLFDFFQTAAGFYPDGVTSRQHHQQYHDLYNSSKPTFRFHQVRCYECHDPHLDNDASIREVMYEQVGEELLPIPTRVDDNTLCLACHATHGPFVDITKEIIADYEANRDAIAAVVTAHTHHPYAPERLMGLSRCTGCHMPKTAKSGDPYDIHSHTFEAISPEKTLLYQDKGGMPNSCGLTCHARFGLEILPNHSSDGSLTNWAEQSDRDRANWLLTKFREWWGGDEEGEE